MRELKATLFSCVAAARVSTPRAPSRSAAWRHLQRRRAGAAVFAAHADQHDERLEAEARLAVRRRRTPARRRRVASAGARPSRFSCAACSTPPPRGGRSSRSIRRPGRRSGSTSSRRAAPRTAACRTGPATAGLPPRILAGTTDGRLLALDAATGKPVPTFGDHGAIDLRAGVADKYPEDAVPDGVARAHLPEPDRHRRAGPGGQPRRPGDGRPRVGCQDRQARLDLSHDPASGRARMRTPGRRTTG